MRGQIEFIFNGDLDKEFADDYIKTILQMMYMFHFVDSVVKCEVTQEGKEFLVDYNDCYVKSVYANSEEEAKRLVLDEKQGDTLYFSQEVNEVEVKQ